MDNLTLPDFNTPRHDRRRACCFTGHREMPAGALRQISDYLDELLPRLCERGFDRFYVGGAYGFDLLAAERVAALIDAGTHRPALVLALPFPGHDSRWYRGDRERLARVLTYAETVYVSQHYHTRAYAVRNRYMVEHSSLCIACLDPSRPRSGTAQTVSMARREGLTVYTYEIKR